MSLRRQIYHALDSGFHGSLPGRYVHGTLLVLILVNVFASVLATVPSLGQAYKQPFFIIEVVTATIFIVEYVARLWCATEHRRYAGMPAWKARLKLAASFDMIFDLLSILPLFLSMLFSQDLKVLLVFRLFRFLKVARYSPGMRSLMDAVYIERRALGACGIILAVLILLSASFMHFAENEAQPDKFGSIPDAMYWAIVTLTTVGYGDVVPITPLGKAIAGMTAVLGVCMLALPVGILATAFSEVIHRRDFVVTWSMVTSVPLFNELDAGSVSEIMQVLTAQKVEAGEVIIKQGDPAYSMYFIAAGEVEFVGNATRLGVGEFFGEGALLSQLEHTATARALIRTSLLVLGSEELRSLMERRPAIGEHIRSSANGRAESVKTVA